jgi:hypothetical protein
VHIFGQLNRKIYFWLVCTKTTHAYFFFCALFLIPDAALTFYHFAENQELWTLADKINLRVPDLNALVEKINTEGYLIKKGSGMYQVKSYRSG